MEHVSLSRFSRTSSTSLQCSFLASAILRTALEVQRDFLQATRCVKTPTLERRLHRCFAFDSMDLWVKEEPREDLLAHRLVWSWISRLESYSTRPTYFVVLLSPVDCAVVLVTALLIPYSLHWVTFALSSPIEFRHVEDNLVDHSESTSLSHVSSFSHS